jgi:hypothetical protein
MFFIVWRGLGILVPVMAIAVLIFGAIVESMGVSFGLPQQQAVLFGEVIGSLLAGAALFFIARKIESQPQRVLVDQATNQRVVIKRNAGSFFFVPTRYWSFILPAMMIALALYATLSPTRHGIAGMAASPSSIASTPAATSSATPPSVQPSVTTVRAQSATAGSPIPIAAPKP